MLKIFDHWNSTEHDSTAKSFKLRGAFWCAKFPKFFGQMVGVDRRSYFENIWTWQKAFSFDFVNDPFYSLMSFSIQSNMCFTYYVISNAVLVDARSIAPKATAKSSKLHEHYWNIKLETFYQTFNKFHKHWMWTRVRTARLAIWIINNDRNF